jgi:hypothetical protein
MEKARNLVDEEFLVVSLNWLATVSSTCLSGQPTLPSISNLSTMFTFLAPFVLPLSSYLKITLL